ncbi:hypothetical protein NHQ30_007278 [Ciborinia camelliae]|nr:hypothetical protein NHQ30_007278 [Ciborinia camelliae]
MSRTQGVGPFHDGFSSISGVLGMPGLGNYAAANTFLDALAHLRRAQGLPATSIAYSVWGGDGMAVKLTGRTTLTHLAKFGLDPLKSEEGLELFQQAVYSGRALTVAAALDPERLRAYLEEESGDEKNAIPPFYRSLLNQQNNSTGDSAKSSQKDKRNGNLRKVLINSRPEEHAKIVLAMVQETVAKALGFTTSHQPMFLYRTSDSTR